MKEFVEESRKELPQDTELQNLVDEIADLINSTLYKLRYLE
jgi:Tfp pilus assembly protein PilO